MKLFVWRGHHVLQNYGSGIAIVAAVDREQAWAKLFVADFRAAFWLQTGCSFVFDQDDFAVTDPDRDDSEWTPIEPEEFSLETLPVLVKEGGE